MVVAQLAERSLPTPPTPEIRGSNPDIGNKIFKRNYLSIAIQKKKKIKKKRPGMVHLKKKLGNANNLTTLPGSSIERIRIEPLLARF